MSLTLLADVQNNEAHDQSLRLLKEENERLRHILRTILEIGHDKECRFCVMKDKFVVLCRSSQ